MSPDSRQGSECGGAGTGSKTRAFLRAGAGALFVLHVPDHPATQLSPVHAQGFA